jgi:hypothetical protein
MPVVSLPWELEETLCSDKAHFIAHFHCPRTKTYGLKS